MRRIILINLLLIVILFGGGGGLIYYLYQSKYFITTDDAMIQGDIVTLASPATGTLTSWGVTAGNTYNPNQNVGTVSGAAAIQLTAPIQGTAISSNAVQGQTVTQGQILTRFVNLNKLYVIANVDETDINDVAVGKDVDVTIDAFPGTTYKGTVDQVGNTTTSVFSLMPAGNTSGTYTKVTQRIPVRIAMSNYPKGAIPGLNVTVRIHR